MGWKEMAGWTGLEPAASGLTGRRYNQLNYHPETDFFYNLLLLLANKFSITKEFRARIRIDIKQSKPP